MALTVANLASSRAGLPVLRGVNLDLADGGVLILRGPNGAGKSTLIRCLASLLPSIHDRIAIDAIEQGADPDGYCERVAYAGHLDAVKPQLTVAENLAFWAALFGGGGVAAALEAFGLGHIAARPAQFCSAGQKRRLGLSRMLVATRRLWLLDEPTVSLDTAAVAMLRAAVLEHCAGGGMAVIAAHGDLGLPAAATLDLTPLPAGAGEAGDPFLAGALS